MIGQTILHYQVTAKIGAGGMGDVYLATDTKLDRQVALKFLSRQFSGDADARTRFQREAKALAALNHPNIVSVFDVLEHDGIPFIAMEYVDGQTVKQLIASGDVAIDRILHHLCGHTDDHGRPRGGADLNDRSGQRRTDVIHHAVDEGVASRHILPGHRQVRRSQRAG